MFRVNAVARLLANRELLEEALTDKGIKGQSDKASGVGVVEESADASPYLYNVQNPVPNGMM